nr:hypothetical protein CFP56_63369 [Quercus suber]POE94787.1 hypothetical protein CFP56_17024 [Quercus suber]
MCLWASTEHSEANRVKRLMNLVLPTALPPATGIPPAAQYMEIYIRLTCTCKAGSDAFQIGDHFPSSSHSEEATSDLAYLVNAFHSNGDQAHCIETGSAGVKRRRKGLRLIRRHLVSWIDPPASPFSNDCSDGANLAALARSRR